MYKRKSVRKLGRTHAHRKAMLRNMATSLFQHERIVTTRVKSKVLRTYAEPLISLALKKSKGDALHIRRQLLKHLRGNSIVQKLMEDIAPRFEKRNGGYLRIIHLPQRKSDVTNISIIELVDRKEKVKKIGKKSSASTSQLPNKKDDNQVESKKTSSKWYQRLGRNKQSNFS